MPGYSYYSGRNLTNYLITIEDFLIDSCDWIQKDRMKAAGLATHIAQVETELMNALLDEDSFIWVRMVMSTFAE